MKEVKKCSISGIAFTMEADAFQVLSRYLESLNDTYRNTDGGKEIVEDIEARIAELILSHQDNSKVVELSLVEEIIAQMGSAEAIREQEAVKPRAAKAGFRVACTGIWTGAPGRCLFGCGQVFRDQSHVDPSADVPAAHSVAVVGMDSVFLVACAADEQLARRVLYLLPDYVVRCTGSPYCASEARTKRTADYRTIHRGGFGGESRCRCRCQTGRCQGVYALGQVVLIVLKLLAGLLVFG